MSMPTPDPTFQAIEMSSFEEMTVEDIAAFEKIGIVVDELSVELSRWRGSYVLEQISLPV
jgi:hypothetical protein